MRLHKRLYDPILLKREILYYCKGLIKLLTSHSKLLSEDYHNNLSSNENQISMTNNQEIMYTGKDFI